MNGKFMLVSGKPLRIIAEEGIDWRVVETPGGITVHMDLRGGKMKVPPQPVPAPAPFQTDYIAPAEPTVAQMIHACESTKHDLAGWERTFIRIVAAQVGQKRALKAQQLVALKAIYKRASRP